MKTGMHTGRMAGEHHDRGQDDVLTSQGMLKIASKAPEARRRHGMDPPTQPSTGINPADTLILHF